MFLGDNIYPAGMGLPGSREEEKTKEIFQSQFIPMRNKNAAVYFIPGNHDWDNMGPDGLAKIKEQWSYLEDQNDSLLKLVPPNGCPDPYEINISDSLVIIAFDSDWWLFPYNKENPDAGCNAHTTEEVIELMNELFYKNRHKVILLVSHHPFQTFGNHGGYFSLKDHIFPLTKLNKHLYIPLPVIGSLYLFFKKTFPNPEDINNPLYQTMIRDVNKVFASSPNVIHVAGHEHGLQFIKDNQTQVVSGAGAKSSYIRQNKKALFENASLGFVVADLLPEYSMRFTYYVNFNDSLRPDFTYVQSYTNVMNKEDSIRSSITSDSVTISINPKFDDKGKLYRFFFGENYRKIWALNEKLPVIRLSEFKGGLTPLKLGGGHQTRSLRLQDNYDNEWMLRSVEKNPEVLIPLALRTTFLKNIALDAISAENPYGALIVPTIAKAALVPHATPIIGYTSPDIQLGIYSREFENTVDLLEKREPLGKSDNFTKMVKELQEDNDNSFDGETFLRARLLDILIGDWDRHTDQWRFVDTKKGKGKHYIPVPRDRDQAFYVNEGLFPKIASLPWVQPFLEGFKPKIRNVATFLFTSTMMNARFLNQFSYEEWMRITNEFIADVTDSVLEKSLQNLPAKSYQLENDKLLAILKARRNNLPHAMSDYYHKLYKSAFIQTSDKNEFVEIKDAPNEGMQVIIHKISGKGEIEQQIFANTYYPSITKEVRLFTGKGKDSIIIDNKNSPVKLRISGTDGNKSIHVLSSKRKVSVFQKENTTSFFGKTRRLKMHLSNNRLNTAIKPGNLFNVTAPLLRGGYNLDDGVLIGAGLNYYQNVGYTLPSFNLSRHSGKQQIVIVHSFSTKAFSVRYSSEWTKVIGSADLTIKANAFAPENTQNYFGSGNETVFNKTGQFKKYYRVRFGLYEVEPLIRWGNKNGTWFSVGPSFHFYHFNYSDNVGRVIENTPLIKSYDSLSINKSKIHGGITLHFVNDKRNDALMPRWGSYFNLKISYFTGLNKYSKSFLRLNSDISLYKSLNAKSSIILAERLGGAAIIGDAAFYQSVFLGGQGNMLGYRQFRFAGHSMVYNNLELRIKLSDFASNILAGEFGLIGLHDIGRVWLKNDHSRLWHNGYGGGFYFAPANVFVFRAVAVSSTEGIYPYIDLNFRF